MSKIGAGALHLHSLIKRAGRYLRTVKHRRLIALIVVTVLASVFEIKVSMSQIESVLLIVAGGF